MSEEIGLLFLLRPGSKQVSIVFGGKFKYFKKFYKIYSYVLSEILSDKGVDEILELIHKYLTNLGEEIRQDKIPIAKFLITKVIFYFFTN